MTYLLDVNVLIALIDPLHTQHEVAHQWFSAYGAQDWATCPITENGVLRIVGHPRYPNSPGTPAVVAQLVKAFYEHPGHAFWPDSVSSSTATAVNCDRLLTSAQVTDTYLLALAAAHGAQLATFDRHLITVAVADGARALHLIQAS